MSEDVKSVQSQILQELHRRFRVEGPDGAYHSSNLATSIGIPPAEVTLALMSLQEKGLIQSEWVGSLALVTLTSRGVRLAEDAGDEIWTIVEGVPPEAEQFQNLPARTTRHFVGREHKISTILDLFDAGVARTLVAGGPGIGKTTLVLEIAHRCSEMKVFKAIVWSTAEWRSDITLDRLLDTIAGTLHCDGYKRLPRGEKALAVLRELRALRTLMVMDDFENVHDPEIEPFLRELPNSVRLLIASRYLHAVPEEEVIPLREFTQAETLELVRAKSEMKRLGRASDETLRGLHKATGGMPLALDWAVGQINTGRQTLESVVRDLETAKATAVYSTLFDTSYRSLTETERQILWAQSVFIGPSTKAALQFVADLTSDDLEAGLLQLVEMSLVYSNEEFEEPKIRYSIHALLRNFAQRELSQQDGSVGDGIVERFVGYYSDYCDREISSLTQRKRIAGCEFEIGIEDISSTMRWAEVELDNISAAMDLCHERNYWDALLRLVKALSYFYATKGYWSDRIHRGQQAAKAAAEMGDKKAEAWILINELGYVFIQQGKYDKAHEFIERGQELLDAEMRLLRTLGEVQEDDRDQQGIKFMSGLAKRYLGIMYTKKSAYETAEQHFREAMEIFTYLNRESIVANQKTEMGELALRQNEYMIAERYYRESLDYHDSQKDRKPWVHAWMARAHNGLGDVARCRLQHKVAKDSYQRGLGCALRIGSQDGIAYSKYRLAVISEHERKHDLALQLAEESLHIVPRVGKADYVADLEAMIERLRSVVRQE